MDIVVCIKQVPDTTEVKIDPKTNTLVRQGVPSIVNPFDKNAIEAGLRLKEKYGGRVTVVSMGPPQANDALKECLAMGADDAVLVSDRAFGGADTLATSYTLAATIRALGHFDVILCGKQAIDGDTAQVGPEMAEHLGITQLTYVAKIDIQGDTVQVYREHEEGYEVVEARLPVLLSVVKSINVPRYPTVKGIMKAVHKDKIRVLSAKDLEVDMDRLGLKGSATQVRQIFTPPQRGQGILIRQDSARKSVDELMAKLSDAKIV
jgi:electron transfer flavoprotein beta subunit